MLLGVLHVYQTRDDHRLLRLRPISVDVLRSQYTKHAYLQLVDDERIGIEDIAQLSDGHAFTLGSRAEARTNVGVHAVAMERDRLLIARRRRRRNGRQRGEWQL